mgnify:FL=1
MLKIKLCLLDVWGNESDGFEVNDRGSTLDIIEVPKDISNADLLKLITKDYLKGYSKSYELDLFGDDHILGNVLHKNTGMPIMEIEEMQS